MASAIFSLVLLKKKLFGHHILAVILILIGIIIAGIAKLFMKNNSEEVGTHTSWYGIVILIVGNIIWSL